MLELFQLGDLPVDLSGVHWRHLLEPDDVAGLWIEPTVLVGLVVVPVAQDELSFRSAERGIEHGQNLAIDSGHSD